MKEIKRERIVFDVIGYEAVDGTQFDSKEECEKYEKITAKAVIIDRFKKLVVNYIEEAQITCLGDSFVGSGGGENYYLALVKIENEKDLDTLRMYKELAYPRSPQQINEDLIGKEIIVGIGEIRYDYENKGYCNEFDFDNCWIYGTIEEQIELYTKQLMQIKNKPFTWD